jgi:hypothetical protein
MLCYIVFELCGTAKSTIFFSIATTAGQLKCRTVISFEQTVGTITAVNYYCIGKPLILQKLLT